MAQKKQQTNQSESIIPFSKHEIMAMLLILAVGGIVYGRCVTYDYVLYDDPNIIFQNDVVLEGFSPSGVYHREPNFFRKY